MVTKNILLLGMCFISAEMQEATALNIVRRRGIGLNHVKAYTIMFWHVIGTIRPQ